MNFASEFKVGMLVVVVGAMIAFMSMQVSDDPSLFGRSQQAWFVLDNAGGLVKNSAVRAAGIPVGTIKDITLYQGRARIDIAVNSDVPLTKSATVEIKSMGILGDMHVEIYPGSPTDAPLESGGQITQIKSGGSLDKLMSSVTEVTTSLKEVAENLREATAADGTNKTVLGRIIQNIEGLTADLRQITSENKGKIGDIVDDVHDIAQTLKDALGDQNDNGLKETWARLSHSISNLDEITSRINNGEGAVGKLISDEQTSEAVDGVAQLMDLASRTETGFDFRTEYLGDIGENKTFVGVTIRPGLDRYYYLGIVDDPAGVVEVTRTKTEGSPPGGPAEYTETKTYLSRLKFNVWFAKNFWDFTIRGGIIESSGGAGIDYHFFRNKLRFTVEAFDMNELNIRSYITWNLYRGFYLTGGISDALDNKNARSGYLGVGLTLTNDDIKVLAIRMF